MTISQNVNAEYFSTHSLAEQAVCTAQAEILFVVVQIGIATEVWTTPQCFTKTKCFRPSMQRDVRVAVT